MTLCIILKIKIQNSKTHWIHTQDSISKKFSVWKLLLKKWFWNQKKIKIINELLSLKLRPKNLWVWVWFLTLSDSVWQKKKEYLSQLKKKFSLDSKTCTENCWDDPKFPFFIKFFYLIKLWFHFLKNFYFWDKYYSWPVNKSQL